MSRAKLLQVAALPRPNMTGTFRRVHYPLPDHQGNQTPLHGVGDPTGLDYNRFWAAAVRFQGSGLRGFGVGGFVERMI